MTKISMPPPETPPAEAFDSVSAHAKFYNQEEHGERVASAATPPAETTVEIPASEGSPPQPPAHEAEPAGPVSGSEPSAAKEPDDGEPELPTAAKAEESAATEPDEDLYFRDPEGKFRKARGSEIRNKLQKRVDRLTAKNTELEARLTTRPAPPAAASAQTAAPIGDRPKLDDFETLADWQAADTTWIDQRIAADREQVKAETRAKADADAFNQRLTSFKQAHPDYDETIEGVADVPISNLLGALLTSDEHGPAFAYYLGSHPDEYLDLVLATVNTPVVPETLSVMRRRLASRLETAPTNTGSVPQAVVRPASRPISPVRTGRAAVADRPPDENATAAQHAAYYNRLEATDRQRL